MAARPAGRSSAASPCPYGSCFPCITPSRGCVRFVPTTLPPSGGTPMRSVSTVPHRPCITLTHPDTGPRRFTGADSKRTEQALVRHSVPDRTLFRLSHDTVSCPPKDPAQILKQNLSVPFGPGTRRTQILYRTTLQNLYQNANALHNPDTMN